eukprot:TRINITY_DN25016_c0_g1_i1.p1 TRINITY_DN25016_c0_g1~~TRINITY_DN25016_c0_g1_i1.p1  ORF type:complete len:470 (-),score=56.13 TRINITY_DN25016_c0_g1_i1:153-1562(-)
MHRGVVRAYVSWAFFCNSTHGAVDDTDASANYVPASMKEFSGATLSARLKVAGTWPEIMEVFGTDPRFRAEYWGQKPFLARAPAAQKCFSVENVRAAAARDELLAGQNNFLRNEPTSFQTVPNLRRGMRLTSSVLEDGLMNGTMVLNDASANWVQLFEVARSAGRALGFPASVNVYITHAALRQSAPIHTDRQDVIVLQCEGKKHWRVYRPLVPYPAEFQERGKGGDVVSEDEAGSPILEVTLSEGDLLYVPRGFAHSTSRPPRNEAETGDALGSAESNDFSTSLTLGIQTESMGLTYDRLLLCTLFLNGESPGIEEIRSIAGSHAWLRKPMPFPGSFLDMSSSEVEEGASFDGNSPLEHAADQLLEAWTTLQPSGGGLLAASPPPRARVLKAARIVAEGYRQTLSEYESRMFDPSVPAKLRQELWSRRYRAIPESTLGKCGWLTRCFQKKFWLAKYTTQQRCWIGQTS